MRKGRQNGAKRKFCRGKQKKILHCQQLLSRLDTAILFSIVVGMAIVCREQMRSQKKILGLAPMDGITNAAYRTITQEIFDVYNTDSEKELRLRTEFMNAEGFMHEPGRLIHHLMKTGREKHTIAQIYGADENALVETAHFIDTHMPSFAGIELNIGCPSPKVMACGGGAGMMKDRENTIRIIKNITAGMALPFSIKTRSGLTQEDREAQRAFILEAAQYCTRIVIHGRTYKQSHNGDVDRAFITDIKKELGDACCVIGNGGIKQYDSIHAPLETLDGVMIGQAAIGRPWFFVNHTPTLAERYALIVRHAQMMIVLFAYYAHHVTTGRAFPQPAYARLEEQIAHFQPASYEHEKTMIEYRKYLFTYISGLPGSREVKQMLATTKSYDATIGIIQNYFAQLSDETAPV